MQVTVRFCVLHGTHQFDITAIYTRTQTPKHLVKCYSVIFCHNTRQSKSSMSYSFMSVNAGKVENLNPKFKKMHTCFK